jgi:hypothetical protein
MESTRHEGWEWNCGRMAKGEQRWLEGEFCLEQSRDGNAAGLGVLWGFYVGKLATREGMSQAFANFLSKFIRHLFE